MCFYTGSGFPSYGFLPTTTSMASSSERLGTSFYPEYGSASAASQMVATMMAARQGDSLALSTPALLTGDHYSLSQRPGSGLHSATTSAAPRNVLSLPDNAADFGIC